MSYPNSPYPDSDQQPSRPHLEKETFEEVSETFNQAPGANSFEQGQAPYNYQAQEQGWGNPSVPYNNQGHPVQSQTAYYKPPASERYNTLAIVSLVSAFFVSIVAVITGIIALKQIDETGEKGYGMALAGTIIGGLTMIGSVLFFLAFFGVAAYNGMAIG